MAVTNTVRAVLNTTTGRWYLWDRDGDRFEALPANGVALTATGAGTNAVHVYRIIDDRGQFQPMVATSEKPATLKVYVKDPDSGNMALKEAVSCTSFADSHCEFVLAGDYAAETTKYVRLDFADGTAGSITPSFSAVTLYEQRESVAVQRVGTWRILSAAVSGIDDKRVKFESSNPAVCRIERGTLRSSAYINMAESPQQTDEYCVLVGVASGTATITCTALGDGSTATVAVTVEQHPDDDPLPGQTGLAAALEAMLDNVRLPLCLKDDAEGNNGMREFGVAFSRSFVVPGEEGDSFDITLNFAGTGTPTQCAGLWSDANMATHVRPGLLLVVGLANSATLGTPMATEKDGSSLTPLATEAHTQLGCASAYVINGPTNQANLAHTLTENLNKDVTLRVQGGDTIVLGWVFADALSSGEPLYYDYVYPLSSSSFAVGTYGSPPEGDYLVLCTVTACTHHPPNEAP